MSTEDSASQGDHISRLDALLIVFVALSLGLLGSLFVWNLSFQHTTYRSAMTPLLISREAWGHAAVLSYARALDAAVMKTSVIFMGFILTLLGTLYVLRSQRTSFTARVEGTKHFTGAITTASPGLVMVAAGVLTVNVGVLAQTDVAFERHRRGALPSESSAGSPPSTDPPGPGDVKASSPESSRTPSPVPREARAALPTPAAAGTSAPAPTKPARLLEEETVVAKGKLLYDEAPQIVVPFEQGSADVSPEAAVVIKEFLSPAVVKSVAKDATTTILVVTVDEGGMSPKAAGDLSEARARAVVTFVVDLGVGREQIRVQKGPSHGAALKLRGEVRLLIAVRSARGFVD